MSELGCWVCGAVVPDEPGHKNGATNGSNGKVYPRRLKFCDPHLTLWEASHERHREQQTGLFDFVMRLKLEALNSGKNPQ
jgi:hypothetical protein